MYQKSRHREVLINYLIPPVAIPFVRWIYQLIAILLPPNSSYNSANKLILVNWSIEVTITVGSKMPQGWQILHIQRPSSRHSPNTPSKHRTNVWGWLLLYLSVALHNREYTEAQTFGACGMLLRSSWRPKLNLTTVCRQNAWASFLR